MDPLSCLIGSVGIFLCVYVCVFVCVRSVRRCTEWTATAAGNENHEEEEEVLYLRCSWSPLFTDRGKQALLAICTAWPLFHWQESLHSLKPSLFSPAVVTLCFKPEPQLCSYPEEPWRVPPDPQKCLLMQTEQASCHILQKKSPFWLS